MPLPQPRAPFIPALRHEALTPAYDLLIRLTMPELRFKQELIDAAPIDRGQHVLDVGCGEHVDDNFAGSLMPMLEAAGFTMVEETSRLTSIFGVLRTIRAFKARTRRSQESDS